MKREHSWPQGHWDWPINVSHKHGMRCGPMIWVGGQVDLTSDGEVRNAGDLGAQTANAMAYFDDVLAEFGASLGDLVKLLCFYVNDGSVDETQFLSMVAKALPQGAAPAITAVPIPYLAYEGMRVEIEGIAMRAEDGGALTRTQVPGAGLSPLPSPFSNALRCGKMIYVSAQAPVDAAQKVLHAGDIVEQTKCVMAQIETALGGFGAGFDDVVKVNRWYAAGAANIASFEPAALACAAHYSEPGPAATGIPIPHHAVDGVEVKIEVMAMLGEDGAHLPRRHVWPESLWDWHVHLPYKHGLECDGMIFLGGQVSLDKKGEAVHPGDLGAQTRQAMSHVGTLLQALGADYGDVCKVLTLYAGDCGPEDIHTNLSIRSSYFAEPGPATTGVPLPLLAYPDMLIEIDIFAMVET
jgi:enamine deaminase RidA (YjgF/YER057c/UK114 family)